MDAVRQMAEALTGFPHPRPRKPFRNHTPLPALGDFRRTNSSCPSRGLRVRTAAIVQSWPFAKSETQISLHVSLIDIGYFLQQQSSRSNR
jgi:hypothetical protein